MTRDYVELHARSAFSFLRGASFPEQLAERAAELKLPAVALCDRDGVYGAPRFYGKGQESGTRLILGAELTLEDGAVLPVLVESRTGYRNLCRLITQAKLRGTKTDAPVHWHELEQFAEGLVALTGDEEGPIARCLEQDDHSGARERIARLRRAFGDKNVFVEVQRHLRRGEELRIRQLADLASAEQLPLLATNGVQYAMPEQRGVLDVFTCARNHTHLDAAGRLLSANSERYLKSAAGMTELFRDLPEAIANTVALADRLQFTLANLGYEFPTFPVPEGETMATFLRQRVLSGARDRYRGSDFNSQVRAQIDKELALIEKLGFCGYFLCIWDLVQFARENDIMIQGRGSAANSVVCFTLGITACDPIGYKLLFERFLAEGRNAWPDIDLDLPSGDRRERVIQEVYRRFGQHGAAMTANVISFRGRSAMREIGKALNFSLESIGRFSALFANGDFPHTLDLKAQLIQAGIPKDHPRAEAAATLYQMMKGLPRHLGQHSGGMIICQNQLSSFIPLENASMPGRVVAQWDKDDCEDLGIIKVDLLGLGMMSVLQETIALSEQRGRKVELYEVPADDPETYEMIRAADTIGLFQIESRAQMATLPRLKPKEFYDLVVEVAIVRPGPIQGGLMHPYLKRRCGQEDIVYLHKDVETVLEPTLKRTLGVPLFQEQMLKMSMDLAGFNGSEAEELRRALSFHRSHDRMNAACAKLHVRMKEKGHSREVTDLVVKSVQSFAVYGFPESHAISFALLAYASAWYKVHRAPEFYASLLNNQPMGFYSSATLIKDGQRRGLHFLPVSVCESEWNCTVIDDTTVRLGLCVVNGLRKEHGAHLLLERMRAPFTSVADFNLRTKLNKPEQRTLAKIGALHGLSAHRRDALWQIELPLDGEGLFARQAVRPPPAPLAPMNAWERLEADQSGMNLSIGKHPMRLLRDQVPHAWRAADLSQAANGTYLQIAGQVICRQRPGTAKGFVFISLEDETGVANAIVVPQLFERCRLLITSESFLVIEGSLQNHENVIHVKAQRILPLSAPELTLAESHDFR
ncbi:MAG: error-prone DNA polymerase [Chthoniobacter sp.]|uniref:DNA polymerase III subunit alpha n=1 Tax=Chthoniobacter sp. TaxID=2510640 RepID=UPI0032ADF35F